MFMDGDHTNPGRTGSLVVTLPNNATNREPRIIQQFISLATRMAYSALVQAPKAKGITVEKFKSFQINHVLEPDSACAICFEEYVEPDFKRALDSDEATTKRRKTTSGTATPTEPSGNASADGNAAGNATANASADASVNASANVNANATATATGNLSEFTGEFRHLPIQMPCGHTFGQSCLSHWLKENTRCPLCRKCVAEPEASEPGVSPVTYFRFGGPFLDENWTEEETPAAATASEGPAPSVAPSAAPSATSILGDAGGLLRRATLVIFHPRLAREAPPPPLLTSAERRSRNPSATPVVDEILTYFGIQRPRPTEETDPLFASGVSSRRTANGVETVSTDSYDGLTSLTGHTGDTEETQGPGHTNTHGENSIPHEAGSTNSHGTESANAPGENSTNTNGADST